MASKTDIVNRALSKLGEPAITDIDTVDTKAARVLARMWDNVVDAATQAYPWTFAISRSVLVAESTPPLWGFKTCFTLPGDYLALLEIDGNPTYAIEGGTILANMAGDLKIRYIGRVSDTARYHPLFIEALAARLAYEACEEITGDNVKKQAALRDLSMAIDQAYMMEAIENAPKILPESAWLDARV